MVQTQTASGSAHSSGDVTRRKSSLVASVAKAARDQIHFDLQEEDDGPPVRGINAFDGKSFYVPRAALPKRQQIRLLFVGARDDVKARRLLSPYPADRVLNYFDGVIGLVSVLLYEELGWARTIKIAGDPRPVLLSLLCFFHVMVYWLNTHHCLKFSPDVMSLPQVWCMMLYCLGLMLYPLSLGMWIEKGESETYYFINTAICFVFEIFNLLTKIDERANSLFVLWQRGAPFTATIFYCVATVLKCIIKWEGAEYLLYIAPFCFLVPLGAQSNSNEDESEGEGATKGIWRFLRSALQDLRSGNVLSPYPADRALDYFDAVVGLATVFIFLEIGWEVLDGEQIAGLFAALLTYTHVMAYWLNIHHNLKFSPQDMSVLQVWCVVFFSLGMVFYPLCVQAWIEEGSVEIYYIVNLSLSGFMVIFSYLTKIEPGRSRVLYRWWHKMAPIIALIWYSAAFTFLKIGNEQRWMIIVAPFLALWPLGGEKETEVPRMDDCQLPEEEDKFEDNINIEGEQKDESFFDCTEEPGVTFSVTTIAKGDMPLLQCDM